MIIEVVSKSNIEKKEGRKKSSDNTLVCGNNLCSTINLNISPSKIYH